MGRTYDLKYCYKQFLKKIMKNYKMGQIILDFFWSSLIFSKNGP